MIATRPDARKWRPRRARARRAGVIRFDVPPELRALPWLVGGSDRETTFANARRAALRGEPVACVVGAAAGVVAIAFADDDPGAAALIAHADSYTEWGSRRVLFVKGTFGPARVVMPVRGRRVPGTYDRIAVPRCGPGPLIAHLQRHSGSRPAHPAGSTDFPPLEGCLIEREGARSQTEGQKSPQNSGAIKEEQTGAKFRPADPGHEADIGLRRAWEQSRHAPDPPGLENITGNNRARLRVLAKLIAVMCNGRRGTSFFLGSKSVGALIGRPHQTVLNWLAQLERQGVISRGWTGGLCIRDAEGTEYAGGALVPRASEYTFHGFPEQRVASARNRRV